MVTNIVGCSETVHKVSFQVKKMNKWSAAREVVMLQHDEVLGGNSQWFNSEEREKTAVKEAAKGEGLGEIRGFPERR